MTLPRVVQLPVWLEGAVQTLPFYLCAAQIHLGNTPHSGHYRAVFFFFSDLGLSFGSRTTVCVLDVLFLLMLVLSNRTSTIVYLRPIHGSASSDPAGFAAGEP